MNEAVNIPENAEANGSSLWTCSVLPEQEAPYETWPFVTGTRKTCDYQMQMPKEPAALWLTFSFIREGLDIPCSLQRTGFFCEKKSKKQNGPCMSAQHGKKTILNPHLGVPTGSRHLA